MFGQPVEAFEHAGLLVAAATAGALSLFNFFTTSELALLLGNVFSYLVSPKANLLLTLRAKIQVAPDVWDFIFVSARKMAFAPGQYMEWTLAHDDPDERGNRRYFTLASSPNEPNVRVGVKF